MCIGLYCQSTLKTQWEEYKKRPEHRHPYFVTLNETEKNLQRQLKEEYLYINEMYHKWHKTTQQNNQTRKEFGLYHQWIWTNFLNFDRVAAPNKPQLIYRMRQILEAELREALYQNLTVSKDWLTFLEAVAQTESSIYLEHKSIMQPTRISAKKKDKLVKATSSHSNTANTSLNTNP